MGSLARGSSLMTLWCAISVASAYPSRHKFFWLHFLNIFQSVLSWPHIWCTVHRTVLNVEEDTWVRKRSMSMRCIHLSSFGGLIFFTLKKIFSSPMFHVVKHCLPKMVVIIPSGPFTHCHFSLQQLIGKDLFPL